MLIFIALRKNKQSKIFFSIEIHAQNHINLRDTSTLLPKKQKTNHFYIPKDLILDKTFVVDLKTDSNVICTR